ncbi:hypothetical protein DFH09DRAFT_1094499 [Mycena vulgaris]|nr:hypothetical protein DFH09DRAFT_1094499 [Mycena vulgaris]
MSALAVGGILSITSNLDVYSIWLQFGLSSISMGIGTGALLGVIRPTSSADGDFSGPITLPPYDLLTRIPKIGLSDRGVWSIDETWTCILVWISLSSRLFKLGASYLLATVYQIQISLALAGSTPDLPL